MSQEKMDEKREEGNQKEERERKCTKRYLFTVNDKFQIEHRRDVCTYKCAVRLFILSPRTCLSADRWTINVKARGGGRAKG